MAAFLVVVFGQSGYSILITCYKFETEEEREEYHYDINVLQCLGPKSEISSDGSRSYVKCSIRENVI